MPLIILSSFVNSAADLKGNLFSCGRVSYSLRLAAWSSSELYNTSGVRTRVQKVKPKMAEFEEL